MTDKPKRKLSTVEEYLKNGGLRAHMQQEAQKAAQDKKHPLYNLFQAAINGETKKMARLYRAAYKNAETASNPALLWFNLSLNQAAVQYAEENIDYPERREGLPVPINDWAIANYFQKEKSGNGGKAAAITKQKKADAFRCKVLEIRQDCISNGVDPQDEMTSRIVGLLQCADEKYKSMKFDSLCRKVRRALSPLQRT